MRGRPLRARFYHAGYWAGTARGRPAVSRNPLRSHPRHIVSSRKRRNTSESGRGNQLTDRPACIDRSLAGIREPLNDPNRSFDGASTAPCGHAESRRRELIQAHTEIGQEVDWPFGCRLDSLKATFALLQIDGLIVAVPVEFRAPYFVHSLVLGPTVVNRRPKSQIQVPQPLQ